MKIKDGVHRTIVLSSIPIVFAGALLSASVYNGDRASTKPGLRGAVGWEIMKLDANREGRSVEFTHEAHQLYMKKSGEGCVVCHHLNLPDDSSSSCYECHKDMRKESSIFDHELHTRIYKNKGAHCNECHGKDRSREKAKVCVDCHPDYTGPASLYMKVRGYESAMHGNCVTCHKKLDKKLGEPMYSECSFCHPEAE